MAELKNEFSWSKTREECFRRCRRQYWFAYYGAWGGWERQAPARTRTIYVLKQLRTRPLWAGGRVHDAIAGVLREVRRGAPPPAEDAAVARALEAMRADYRDSGEGSYWEEPKKHCALFEHEYDIELPDAYWKETVDRALECIRAFYRTPVFAELRRLPEARWLEIECLASFPLDGLKVFVQLDAAVRTADGGVWIVDWKTGRADTTATREQLAAYTLYAAQRWELPAERILCTECNLARTERFDHPLSAADLDAARASILASAAAMRELLDDPAANTASEAKFDFAADEKTCHSCGFLRLCPRFQENTEPSG